MLQVVTFKLICAFMDLKSKGTHNLGFFYLLRPKRPTMLIYTQQDYCLSLLFIFSLHPLRKVTWYQSRLG